jgi:serine/threonine protein kinase
MKLDRDAVDASLSEELPMPDAVIHPTPQDLTAFGLGKLPEDAAAAVAVHLESCHSCRQAVAAVAPDSFLDKVRAAGPAGSSFPPSLARPANAPSSAGQPPMSNIPCPEVPPELARHPKFLILRELGRGGMGVVYQARHKEMERQVVIKVINRALLDRPDSLERFRREIRSAAQLSHPNIVTAYDAEQVGDSHILVMELVPGQSLAEVVKKKGPLPVAYACHFARQVALGLQHAYERGLVHRDIKPQNLMLTPKGQVKILDFGLAKTLRESATGTELTAHDTYLGTPEYCAPEQAKDACTADIRADLYSLGCTLYFLLSGRPPFREDTIVNTILAHLQKQPQPLHELRPDVPAELWQVVARLLAKEPAQRYQKPIEVAQALVPLIKSGAKVDAKGGSALAQGVGAPAKGTVIAADTGEIKKILRDVPAKTSPRQAPAHEEVSPFADLPSAPAATVPPKQPPSASVWGSLTEDSIASVVPRKSVPVRKRGAATAMTGTRKKWLIGSGICVSVLLLALLGMWASGVFKVRTKDGTIVSLQPDPATASKREVHPKAKQLEDLIISGSVWKGPGSFREGNLREGNLTLYVEQRNGPIFRAVHAYHWIENGELQSVLRNVQGDVKGNVLNYRPTASDGFRVTGMWKNDCLEITDRVSNGEEATAKLKMGAGNPQSGRCVFRVFHRNDTEGWHTLNHDGTEDATQPIGVDFLRNVGPEHENFYWLATSPIPNQKEWGWHAPDKFHGNHSGKFARFLIYQIWSQQAGKPPPTEWYVVLRGSGITLFLDGTTLEPPESGKWKVYCVRLDASARWKKFPGLEPADDEDIKKVLADVTDLRIKGEYGVKSGGCLMTVEFGADDPFKKD